jgi:hypothetical protein
VHEEFSFETGLNTLSAMPWGWRGLPVLLVSGVFTSFMVVSMAAQT